MRGTLQRQGQFFSDSVLESRFTHAIQRVHAAIECNLLEVEHELEEEGGLTTTVLVEYILDADRMATFGGLSPDELSIWKALPYNKQFQFTRSVVQA